MPLGQLGQCVKDALAECFRGFAARRRRPAAQQRFGGLKRLQVPFTQPALPETVVQFDMDVEAD